MSDAVGRVTPSLRWKALGVGAVVMTVVAIACSGEADCSQYEEQAMFALFQKGGGGSGSSGSSGSSSSSSSAGASAGGRSSSSSSSSASRGSSSSGSKGTSPTAQSRVASAPSAPKSSAVSSQSYRNYQSSYHSNNSWMWFFFISQGFGDNENDFDSWLGNQDDDSLSAAEKQYSEEVEGSCN